MTDYLDGKGVELVLSIILAASVPQALEIIINIGKWLWFILSIFYIVITIFFIYKVMEKKPETKRRHRNIEDFLKNFNISLFAFLPFFLKRLLIIGEKSTENIISAIGYMAFTALIFLLWGIFEVIEYKKWGLFIASISVLAFLSLFTIIIIEGWVPL